MRRIGLAAFIAAALVSGVALADQARLIEVSGDVRVNSGKGFVAVSGPVRLNQGDRIVTGAKGSAVLAYPSKGCVFRIGPQSMSTVLPVESCSKQAAYPLSQLQAADMPQPQVAPAEVAPGVQPAVAAGLLFAAGAGILIATNLDDDDDEKEVTPDRDDDDH
jgi:hypothetical protein